VSASLVHSSELVVVESAVLGRRLRKVDRAVDSSVSGAAMVMDFLFGRVSGKECAAGDPGVGSGSQIMLWRSILVSMGRPRYCGVAEVISSESPALQRHRRRHQWVS
jgi:hypothetical protein